MNFGVVLTRWTISAIVCCQMIILRVVPRFRSPASGAQEAAVFCSALSVHKAGAVPRAAALRATLTTHGAELLIGSTPSRRTWHTLAAQHTNHIAELSGFVEALHFLFSQGLVPREARACIFFDSRYAAAAKM